jgi:iron only hydrogenase large subunit-like protein
MSPGAVYSEQAQCQDCYKCLRECPVKAIRVAGGHAQVMQERCIACGRCVAACPRGAKRVRNDLDAVRALLAGPRPVVVSLAPSFVGEYPGAAPRQVAAALLRLGFTAVSETALGAQEVSARLARDLDGAKGRILLSTACPVAVELVRRFLPERAGLLTPVDSPLLAHATLLRRAFGPEVAVVFIGPCIAKKLEMEAAPDRLQGVLTFEDLRLWLLEEGLDPASLVPGEGEVFRPETAAEGAFYPVEGGMAEATRLNMRTTDTRFVTLHGLEYLQAALADLPEAPEGNLFLELLACEGGCIRGPLAAKGSTLGARMKVLDHGRTVPGAYPRTCRIPLDRAYGARVAAAPTEPAAGEEVLREALRRLGKEGPADELNCGSCGYDTCRDLAGAMVAQRAEARMCVSHLRHLAERKANALIRTLPYGVVIVGRGLEIIDCNETFVQLMGEDAVLVQAVEPGLGGARLDKFLDFADRFQAVLDGGPELIRENWPRAGRTLSVSVFTVEPGRVAGALILDVTETELRRQQVIGKAEQVVQGMLANVQEIAFSLGRNAARSEGILNSIIAEFSGDRREGGHGA